MAQEPVEEEQPKKEKSGLGMVGLALLGVAAIGGSFGVSYVFAPAPPAPVEMACEAPKEKPKEEVKVGLIKEGQIFYELEEIVVTIGSEPATRYLKMNATIMTDEEGVEKIKKAKPLLADAFIYYLRSVEVSDFEDPAFYPRIREQLSKRAELVLGGKSSQGVLITEFLLR